LHDMDFILTDSQRDSKNNNSFFIKKYVAE